MRRLGLRLEKALLDTRMARAIVWLIDRFCFRLLWVWGRIRFGAKVSKRGLGCVCAWDVEIKYPENITLGNRVIIGSNATIGGHSRVIIGDDVRISRDAVIETAGLDFSSGKPPYRHISQPIKIESGVWVGARAIILGGVTIGAGAVVAAGSVVTRSVARGDVVAGVPAVSIKKVSVDRECIE